jgi:hypothetical protein
LKSPTLGGIIEYQAIMKKRVLFILILCSVALASCSKEENAKRIVHLQRLSDTTVAEQQAERQEEKLTFEEASRQVDLYWAITVRDVDRLKQYMEKGYDPNRCRGEQGYRDRNPLNIVAYSFYNTYAKLTSGKEIPDPPPDVAMLQMLVEAGADVNRRSYIWCRVWSWDNSDLDSQLKRKILLRLGRPPSTEEEMEEYTNEKIIEPMCFVNDANRVIEAFLKAGADPDKRGHPYPYTLEANQNRITDEEADKYFATGTRPINEAIKKGMRWESQVDLLLQYTTLDTDSLIAARESEDPNMMEKIAKLWKEQNY